MPSSKNYVRDYKQENKTAKARGETGKGSNSGDATRHRARLKLEKKLGRKLRKGEHAGHVRKGSKLGNSGDTKTRVEDASSNMAKGGKAGNKRGKANGGKKRAKKR